MNRAFVACELFSCRKQFKVLFVQDYFSIGLLIDTHKLGRFFLKQIRDLEPV